MGLARRAFRIVLHPRAEWDTVHSEDPVWWSVLFGHVLPLSLLPALGWASGLALMGTSAIESGSPGVTFAGSVALTVLVSVLCVVLLALTFYVLAPMYETERNWNRAMSVAGYGSTPVLLAGVLLIMPVMIMGSMVATLHNFVLYYFGVQQVMGCKQSAAAEYLALSCFLCVVASSGAGALGSALHIL